MQGRRVLCYALAYTGRALHLGTALGAPSTAQPGRIPVPARAHDLCHHNPWRDMKGTHFAQFSAEVLRRGAAAVLPQHLPDRWLDALLEEADLLAPGEGTSKEADPGQDSLAALLAPRPVVLMAHRAPPARREMPASSAS